MAVSDLFVLLVNNNLCIIGAKIIVISLSLAVEDGWEGMDCEVCHLCFVPAKAWINEIRFIIIFAPHLNYHKLAVLVLKHEGR